MLKAARLLGERVPDLKAGSFTLDKVLPVAAGIGGGSADAAAALRLLARLNGLALDDPRLLEVALLTGADVPVCLASRACDMTGVGETLLPLQLAEDALRDGQSARAGGDQGRVRGARPAQRRIAGRRHRRDPRRPAWPEAGASLEDWVEALAAGSNDLEAPAMRIQPVIGEVLAALSATDGAWLARMSGSGATCFAIYENTAEAAARGAEDPARSPRLVGACGDVELSCLRVVIREVRLRRSFADTRAHLQRRLAGCARPPSR